MFSGHKANVLRHASRHGFRSVIRELIPVIRDTIWSQRHIVFYMDSEDVNRKYHDMPEDYLFVYEAKTWDSLKESYRERLNRDQEIQGWGKPSWFELGWSLWLGEIDGDLAILCWWRTSEQSEDFFCPMRKGSDLIYETTTMPEFRGKGMYSRMLVEVMKLRESQGTTGFYASCRDYNRTPRLTLVKMGFNKLGYTSINKYSKSKKWVASWK
jgi:hypothetical protein